MNKINSKINSELNSITASDSILENVLSAEMHEKPKRILLRKRFIIAAAACMALFLTGAGVYNYVETIWRLSDNTVGWYCEETKKLYLEKTIDGVVMKMHADAENFTFEFTGADEVIYTVDDESIMLYARKAEGGSYTVTISNDLAFRTEERSKSFDFTVVDDF